MQYIKWELSLCCGLCDLLHQECEYDTTINFASAGL